MGQVFGAYLAELIALEYPTDVPSDEEPRLTYEDVYRFLMAPSFPLSRAGRERTSRLGYEPPKGLDRYENPWAAHNG